jgi:alanine racemase
MSSAHDRACALLTIDLDAIVANWRALKGLMRPGADCAAAVKGDAYGLGAVRVAPALYAAGCRKFFLATIDEALTLRPLLPADAALIVLGGPLPRTEVDFVEHGLWPVLNSPEQVARWAAVAGPKPPCVVHLDTGMNRLGLTRRELEGLADAIAALRPELVMSHLACSEDAGEAMNAAQRDRFEAMRAMLPPCPASFANSGGIFLGQAFHFQLTRPGAALYGLVPCPAAAPILQQVVALQGRILQVRDVDSPQTVGYGASHRVRRKGRVATVAVGYADGYLRSLGNRGHGILGGIRVPLVGRVSMDLITFDVTEVPEPLARPDDFIELIGPGHTVDDLAAEAGTIGYEILTNLGSRYLRSYAGGSA